MNWNLGFKAASLFLLMHLRVYKRPLGRSWWREFSLLYAGVYSFLLSNIVGVFQIQTRMQPLLWALENQKLKASSALDETELADWKAYFYYYDMRLL